MTLASTTPHWPSSIWDVAILRGLDARARGEIEAAGNLRKVRAGELVHKAGTPADAIHVIVKGRFSLTAVRRGEAEASVIRTAGSGDVLGEEATLSERVDFSAYQMDARCDEEGTVADIPVTVLRRALARSGADEIASRLERAMRRAATHDLLRTTSFTRSLSERDVEILLDAARHVRVPRGDHVYREGEPSEDAYLVADGLLQAQSDDEGKLRIEAYLARGDLFGDAELEGHDARGLSVVANGPAWLVAIPRDVFLVVARRNKKVLDHATRVRGGAPAKLPAGGLTTAHVFKDLYRMRVARSLLVIDQDSCVRCGHCAWSCANVHDDGISRLVRHGERVVAERAAEKEKTPLLVPNSCQHCKNPACMIDCPTGAIGRDARGEVFIREDLCTGCGSCAKACPWDNIAMAARKDARPYPEVAVKCDLCSPLPGGPACVSACPTEAIFRIDPNEALARDPAQPGEAPPVLPARSPAWPWALGAALASLGVASLRTSAWTSGVLAGVLVALLVGYAAVRRAPRLASRMRAPSRVLHVAHLALGILAIGATVSHAGAHASALVIVMAIALASGLFGALVQALVPRRLSRLERRSALPEELALEDKALDERLYAQLSGKSEVVKTLFAKVLRPYARARLGPLALVLSGRSLRAEEKRLEAELAGLLAGHKSDRAQGTGDLVRLVVERRALGAQRMLLVVLRAWVPLHVATSAMSIVLLAAHVWGVRR